MSDQNTITLTADNEQEALDAAAAATAEHDGTPTDEENVDDTTSDEKLADSEGDDNKGEEKPPVDKLEIEETSDEEDGDGDTPASINLEEYYQEFEETGELSEESSGKLVGKLTEAGFENAEDLLAQYMVGRQATVAQERAAAFEVVGGEQNYGDMIGWAKENLSPEQVASFNRAASDPGVRELAIRGLHAQYVGATGADAGGTSQGSSSAKTRVSGAATSVAGHAPIKSMEQLAKLVGTSEYANDPGHRADVDARIEASMKQGFI